MPRPGGSLRNSDALAISARLKVFARRFGSQTDFKERFNVPRSTLRSWTDNTEPAVPATAYLLEMAREGNLSLNWLLLGEGPVLRQRETTTRQAGLMAAIAAELQATEMADDAAHEQGWARLELYGPDAVLRLAVEAVRPVYRQALLDLKYAHMNAHNLMQVFKAVLLEVGSDVENEKIKESILELGTRAFERLLKAPPRPFTFHPAMIEEAQEAIEAEPRTRHE
jgi:hypothetical protein